MPFNNAINANTAGYQSLTSGGVWNGRTFQAGTGIILANADGTAGNTTITATGTAPDPFATLNLVDDFIHVAGDESQTGDTNWEQTGETLVIGGVANHPGIIGLGNNSSGGIFKTDSATTSSIFLGSGILTIEFLVMIDALSTSNVYIGLGRGAVLSEPTSGVYFFYASGTNSGKWVGKTAAASVRSSANSANTVTAGQWDRLKIVVNAAASSVSFYVNGSEITNSPLATNIPTLAVSPMAVLNYAGASTIIVNIDLFSMTYALTTPR